MDNSNINDIINDFNNKHHSFFADLTEANIDDYDLVKSSDELFVINKKNNLLFGSLTNYNLNNLDSIIDDYTYVETGHNFNQYSGKYYAINVEYKTNVLLELPKTYDLWYSSLSRNAKKNVSKYRNRINKELDAKTIVKVKEEITKDDLILLYSYHFDRFNNKGIKSHLDYNQIDYELKRIKRKGILVGIEINNKLCSGIVLIKEPKCVFATFVSHDTAFDSYDLGIYTYCEAIKYCIENDIEIFNFLWEMTGTKRTLGGKLVEIYKYKIYRDKCLKYYISYFQSLYSYQLRKIFKTNKFIRELISSYKKLLKNHK